MARLSDGSLKGSYVLEVASNDGTFLLPFIEKGHKVLGVDPAKNVVDMAFKDGIPTLCKFFGRAVAKDIFKEHGKAKVVFARNVIPHVANLHDVIDGMADCLSDDGIMVIEAHYAKKILEETHYDSIYHEHLCYFTLFSMEKLLNLHGLRVFDIWGSPISGGSMVLFIDKGAHKETPIVTEYRVAERKIKLNEFASWKEFANKAAIHKERLVQMIKDETTRTGRPVLGYGASARSSTLLNYCGIGHYLIPIIADKNPLKQGKYTAGTHIPITTVEQFMSWIPGCICILAWNFADEIKRELYNDYGYTGSFILPLPNDPRLERGD
jgi:2-polyprenyl-3-methyl-5-hydroxy-6-metoxy-1,4-benzoquinol methylase